MAGPYFEGVDEEAGVAEGFDVDVDGAVEGPGVLAGFLAGVGDDRLFAWEEVAIDAAVLGVVLFIPGPGREFRAAEAGVHHDEDESAGGCEDAGDAVEDGWEFVDVLNSKYADRGGEGVGGEEGEVACVGDVIGRGKG